MKRVPFWLRSLNLNNILKCVHIILLAIRFRNSEASLIEL